MMAVQVDRHSWPFFFFFLFLFFFVLLEDFKFKEENKVLTGTDLVYNGSKIHFEYLRKHEECLIYVANMSVF